MLWPTLFVLHAFFFDAVRLPRWAVVAIGVGGVLYPAMRLPVVLKRDNVYQRYNVNLAHSILDPGDTYIAGTDIVHDREQFPRALARLDAFMLANLGQS